MVAADKNNGIGKNGGLPWPYISRDMKHFASVTSSTEPLNLSDGQVAADAVLTANFNFSGTKKCEEDSQKINAVIMGRKTWESIPKQHQPLKNRLNIILTSNREFMPLPEDSNSERQKLVKVVHTYEEAMEYCSTEETINEVFVIGGSSLYETALGKYKEHTKLIFLTRINKAFECDVFMPPIENSEFPNMFTSMTYSEKDKGITFDYTILGNKGLLESNPSLVPTRYLKEMTPHQEYQYLNLIREMILEGNKKNDRTQTGVRSKFGR